MQGSPGTRILEKGVPDTEDQWLGGFRGILPYKNLKTEVLGNEFP